MESVLDVFHRPELAGSPPAGQLASAGTGRGVAELFRKALETGKLLARGGAGVLKRVVTAPPPRTDGPPQQGPNAP
jgi:hypothetical protein